MKTLYVLPLIIALAACNMPSSRPAVPVALNAGGPHTWVDAPLDQMHLPMAPYEVVFHGTDDAAVTNVELRINDQSVPVPPPQSGNPKLLTAKYMWSPPAPGMYVLRARSLNSAGTWSAEAAVTVWVEGVITPTHTSTPTGTITTTPTLTPTLTPTPVTPAPAGPLTIEFLGASPQEFYFGAESCGPTSVNLQVRVSDPARILGVTLFYKLRAQGTGKYTDWNSDIDLRPQGNGNFAVALSSRSVNGIPSAENWLIYQFIGTGADHQPNSRTQVYSDVSLLRCGSGPSIPSDTWQLPPVWHPIVPEPTPTIEVVR